MARFDVYAYDNADVPLVVDVQANLLADLNSRAVIPLMPKSSALNEAIPRLKPIITIKNNDYILMTTDIGTVPKASLGEHITNVEKDHRQTITEALDFLFSGF